MTYLSNVLVPVIVGYNTDPFADTFRHRIIVGREMIGCKIGPVTMAVVDNQNGRSTRHRRDSRVFLRQ